MQSLFATGTGGGSDGRAGVGVGPAKSAVRVAGGSAKLPGAGRGAAQLTEEAADNCPKKDGGFFLRFSFN